MDQQPQTPSVPSDGSADKTSEKGTKKSSKILIPILIVIALAGVGFGIFGILLKLKSEQPNCIVDTIDIDIPEESAAQETPTPTEINPQIENTYANFARKLTTNRNPLNVAGFYFDSTDSISIAEARIDSNGHLQIIDRNDGSSENDEIIFEGDGYLSASFVRTGNGGVPHFYLISDDGTVSRISIAEDGRKIQKLEGYSGIISVLNGGDLYALLIDVNGNIYRDAGI